MQCIEINDLAVLLRKDGDKILNATSKLSLSAPLLKNLNKSFEHISPNYFLKSTFHVLESSEDVIDLKFIYDFLQKTIGLKVFSDSQIFNDDFIDLRLFHSLRLFEVHRIGLSVFKGLKNLRSQLEYLTCTRSLRGLSDVLETCGGDFTEGYVWSELKEAVFTHNSLKVVDSSLELAPKLQSLNLSFNQIKTLESLNCLSYLKYLNLANNQIEKLPSFNGQICFNLRVLILQNNYLDNINEIEALINLRKLDLSNNSLIDYQALSPLSNLAILQYLTLKGNPMSYDYNYRWKVSYYLHNNVIRTNFTFDKLPLTKKQMRVVNSVQESLSQADILSSTSGSIDSKLPNADFESSSYNSHSTGKTVIERLKQVDFIQTSDMEVSTTSVEVEHGSIDAQKNLLQTFILQEQAMQDSGFVSSHRPFSRTDSIGSATSLQSESRDRRNSRNSLHYSESDIEILSNPSQSSIEVLSSTGYNCPSIAIPVVMKELCVDKELQVVIEEIQRSL